MTSAAMEPRDQSNNNSICVATDADDAAAPVDQELIDEVDLAALGHGQALSRKFDLWSILALAFCVLGTWSTFAQVCL